MINVTQRQRVRFHLGYPGDQPGAGYLEVYQNLALDNLDPTVEFAVFGDISQPGAEVLDLMGMPVAVKGSLLYRCETAFNNLSPDVIADSLFVKQAGSVTLRPDELPARRSLYRQTQKDLARALNIELWSGQLGGGPLAGGY